MTFVLAWISNQISEKHVREIDRFCPQAKYSAQTKNVYLVATGASISAGESDESGAGVSTLSAGIRSDGHFNRSLHFTVESNRLTCDVDDRGLRCLYVTRASLCGDPGIVVTTRLDWAAQVSGNAELNIDTLGSHWTAFNQFATNSLVKGVSRIANGSVQIQTDGWLAKVSIWTPSAGKNTSVETVAEECRIALDKRAFSLGLSGGLDSRLLLALLQESGETVNCHVFGDSGDPDVSVSQELGRLGTINHRTLAVPDLSTDETISLMQEYCAVTCATTPATAAPKFLLYGEIGSRNQILVDGAFGEIGRMQYLNRLRLTGRRHIRSKNATEMLPHFATGRADIFNESASLEMGNGAARELEQLLASLPPRSEEDVDNMLDLISIRTRLPNFYGYGQTWVDHLVENYMPFTSDQVLSSVFVTPKKLRRNGREYRAAIRIRAKSLTSVPLIKGRSQYPFLLGGIGGTIWAKAHGTLRRPDPDGQRHHILGKLKEFILDLMADRSFQEFSLYDPNKIRTLVDAYYSGNESLAAAVDWWLAFELWRRSLERR